jgi:hypothetical protein
MLIFDLFIRQSWWWLCRSETCCVECNFKNKRLVVFDWGLYLVWIEEHIGMTNVKVMLLAYFANLFTLILQKDTVVAFMSVGLAVHVLLTKELTCHERKFYGPRCRGQNLLPRTFMVSHWDGKGVVVVCITEAQKSGTKTQQKSVFVFFPKRDGKS